MCYIGNFYKTKELTKADLEFVVEGLAVKARQNPDGFGLVAYNAKGDVLEAKRMQYDAELMARALLKYDAVHIHLRLATTGSKCLENIHWFSSGQWRFAHNGTVYLKTTKAEKIDISDSEAFFRLLVRRGLLKDDGRVAWRQIDNVAQSSALWGRFVILNLDKRRAYYFGDFEAQLIGGLVSIGSASFGHVTQADTFGLSFTKDVSVGETSFEGITRVNVADMKLVWLTENFNQSLPYKHGESSNYYDSKTGGHNWGGIHEKPLKGCGDDDYEMWLLEQDDDIPTVHLDEWGRIEHTGYNEIEKMRFATKDKLLAGKSVEDKRGLDVIRNQHGFGFIVANHKLETYLSGVVHCSNFLVDAVMQTGEFTNNNFEIELEAISQKRFAVR